MKSSYLSKRFKLGKLANFNRKITVKLQNYAVVWRPCQQEQFLKPMFPWRPNKISSLHTTYMKNVAGGLFKMMTLTNLVI